MNITKLDEGLVKEAFKVFGVLARYQFLSGIEKRCRVIVDHEVVGFPGGWESQVQDTHVVIALKGKDVGRPQQGDRINVRDSEYTVSRVVSDDGVVVKVAVN